MTDPSDPSPILARLAADLAEAQAILHRAETTLRAATGQAPHAVHAPVQVADDADLDGQWGNPEVRKNPPRWQGQDCTGLKYSDCPPEFLDTLAGFLDWKAGKAEEKNDLTARGQPLAPMIRRDAARARGWSARIRAKATAHRRPVTTNPTGRGSMNDADEDVPF